MIYITAALFVLFALLPMPSFAGSIKIVIDKRESFANGYEFPGSGAYEKIAGKAYGALFILAMRTTRSSSTWTKCRAWLMDASNTPPISTSCSGWIFPKGDRKTIYDAALPRGQGAAAADEWDPLPDGSGVNNPATVEVGGNAFLVFRQGYTLARSGWEPRPRRARAAGSPSVSRWRRRAACRSSRPFATNLFSAPASKELGLAAPLSYEAAILDQKQARLTVREQKGSCTLARVFIPVAKNVLMRELSNCCLKARSSSLASSMIFAIRKNPKVLGIGYAATRYLVSFLRYRRTTSGKRQSVGGGQ